ncbi:MAG: response regulator transcription factor [Campylobacterota bacterium]|nr:response regulator transcription factor [Campylobacterota bacterium]
MTDEDVLKLSLLLTKSKNFNILYVEDCEAVRKQTLKMLSNYFTNIQCAFNGADGLKLFRKSRDKIDIIFTDINMPKMDGINMSKEIRKIDKVIPIVIISAYEDKQYFLDCIKVGIEGYLVKPYDHLELAEVIEKIIIKNEQNDIINLAGNFKWNKSSNQLFQNNEEIPITKNERSIFEILTQTPNRIFSASDLEIYVFDDDKCDNSRIRNLIYRLKNKLNFTLIETLYSQGYKLKRQ